MWSKRSNAGYRSWAESKRLFKKLTPDNWHEVDRTASHIVRVREDDTENELNEDDWAGLILQCELSSRAPEDLCHMFEVARGVLCYGCYFYPLYTLGSEQLYRVLNAALIHKCRQMNAPKEIDGFYKALQWLNQSGTFSEARFNQWDASRGLRNDTSHANCQHSYDPTMALTGIIPVSA